MAKVFSQIDEAMAAWIGQQHLFFVSTAPLQADGLINCSPKGLNTFRILGPQQVAYLDLTGSGVETIAHLRENGRIVVMFCALEGAPKIVRFHGQGEVLEPHQPAFSTLRPLFPELPGVRSIILVNVQRISDSCGFGVPRYAYQAERDALPQYAEQQGVEGMQLYRVKNNAHSLNGLPGVTLHE
jgi:hypothetical protein